MESTYLMKLLKNEDRFGEQLIFISSVNCRCRIFLQKVETWVSKCQRVDYYIDNAINVLRESGKVGMKTLKRCNIKIVITFRPFFTFFLLQLRRTTFSNYMWITLCDKIFRFCWTHLLDPKRFYFHELYYKISKYIDTAK